MFPKMVEEIVTVSKIYDTPIGILAYAGDGNLHPLVLFDERNKDDIKKVHKIEQILIKRLLSLVAP